MLACQLVPQLLHDAGWSSSGSLTQASFPAHTPHWPPPVSVFFVTHVRRNKISVVYKGVVYVANLAGDGSIEYQGGWVGGSRWLWR